VAKICLSALLLTISAWQSNQFPLIAGWLAMFGIVLVLHFGIFELLAIIWQRAGINAQPLMQSPLRSRSLAEFWGKRWNSAFNNLAHEFAFRPLARRWGSGAATLTVFAISGLIHEAVISLPARAGYGLPTAYFLLQGCGLLLERSRWGHHAGLQSGLRGRLFALAVAAIPAFWLFHPPFIHRVILPMLHFISQN
jgi:alginate O-acetyltransferase complex protein AlgI